MRPKSLTKYLLIDQALMSGLSNAFINGLIAVAIKHSAESIALFGDDGVSVGLIAMGFLLPLILTVINSIIIERFIQAKKISFPINQPNQCLRAFSQKPYWLIGLCCGICMAILTAAVIMLLKPENMPVVLSVVEYGFLVAAVAGLMAAITSPITAYFVMVRYSPAV